MDKTSKRIVLFYMYLMSFRNLPFIFWVKILFKILGILKFLSIPAARKFPRSAYVTNQEKPTVVLELRHNKFSSAITESSAHLLSYDKLWLAVKNNLKMPFIFRHIRKCLRRNCLTYVCICFSFSSAIPLVLLQYAYNNGQNTFRRSVFKHSFPSP